MSTRILTLTTAVVIAALAAVPAHAQGGVEFGGFGSYTQFDTSLALKERAGAGARLSLISGSGWSTFILEAEGGYSEQKIGLSSLKYIPARAPAVLAPDWLDRLAAHRRRRRAQRLHARQHARE